MEKKLKKEKIINVSNDFDNVINNINKDNIITNEKIKEIDEKLIKEEKEKDIKMIKILMKVKLEIVSIII